MSLTNFTDLFTEKELQEKLTLDVQSQPIFESKAVRYDTDFTPDVTTLRQFTSNEERLASILANPNPKEAIIQRQEAVWKKATQSLLLKTIMGVATCNKLIVPEDFDNIRFFNEPVLLIMHSKVFKEIRKNNWLIYTLKGNMEIPYYKGMEIIVDDYCYEGEGIYPTYVLQKDSILYNDYVDLTDPFIKVEELKPQKLITAKNINITIPDCIFKLSDEGYYPTDTDLSNPDNWEGITNKIQTFNIVILN